MAVQTKQHLFVNPIRRFSAVTSTVLFSKLMRVLPPVVIGVLVLVLWYLGTRSADASFIIASPQQVIEQFGMMLAKGTLIHNLFATLAEVALGLLFGVSAAFILGYGIAHSVLLERFIGPYAVGFQAVPLVVIAPTLIYVFGPGLLTNSLICALIIFFPMLINTVVAMRGVDPAQRDVMASLMATRWQTFMKLELPATLPMLFGGLKISMILGVVGAVVAEAVSSDAGLGFLIYSSKYVYNTAGVMVGVLTLTVLTLLMYQSAAKLEQYFLSWRRPNR